MGGDCIAKFAFKGSDEYALKLSQFSAKTGGIAKRAIYAGAEVVADEIKARLGALPTDEFRYLKNGDKFDGVPKGQKQDLIDSFGITDITQDSSGIWSAKIGFHGYGSLKTKKYPKGVPNQLIARSIESGSSVRQKRPFVRPAVDACKSRAMAAMEKEIDDAIKQSDL